MKELSLHIFAFFVLFGSKRSGLPFSWLISSCI